MIKFSDTLNAKPQVKNEERECSVAHLRPTCILARWMQCYMMASTQRPHFQCIRSQLTPPSTASWPVAKVHSWQSLTYQNVAINPEGCPLLGMKWQDKYFDMVLSFGLCSPLFIFSATGYMVEWLLVHNHGADFLCHYLNDFLTLRLPSSPVCHNNLYTCLQLHSLLGLPLHLDKLKGASACLTIPGIDLDSDKLQARLLTEKLRREIRSSHC